LPAELLSLLFGISLQLSGIRYGFIVDSEEK